jgi:hypothetical protein
MRFTGVSEFLLFGLLFAAILLFNFVMQWLGRRARWRRAQQEQEQHDRQQAGAPPLPPAGPIDVGWGRPSAPHVPAHVPAAAQRRSAAPTSTVRTVDAPRRAPRRTLLGSRRDLRHAIALMTVLGPCRALQPYDMRQGQAAGGGAAPPEARP